MKRYSSLVLIALVCISGDILAMRLAASPVVQQLRLERTLPFDGERNEVAGSLFRPTAVVRSSGRGADRAVLALGADGKPTSARAGGRGEQTLIGHFSKNGRFVVLLQSDKPSDDVSTLRYQATLHEIPSMRGIWTRELALGWTHVSNDGKVVVLASTQPEFPHFLEFLDESGRLVKRIVPRLRDGSFGQIGKTALASSGAFFVVATGATFGKQGDAGATIAMYDGTGEQVASHTSEETTPQAVDISPNEAHVAAILRTGVETSTLVMFDRRLRPLYQLSSDDITANRVSFSPDSMHVIVSSPCEVQLRETATGRKLWEVSAETLLSGEGVISTRGVAVGRSGDRAAVYVARRASPSGTHGSALVIFDKDGTVVAKQDFGPDSGDGGHGILLELSEDNQRIAVRGLDGSIRYYAIPDLKGVSR